MSPATPTEDTIIAASPDTDSVGVTDDPQAGGLFSTGNETILSGIDSSITENALAAKASADAAKISESNAASSATSASTSATNASTSAANAATSATSAASDLASIGTSLTDAETARDAAQAAQAAAETAETNAETAETNAQTAQTAAETAKTAAELAETNAETAETNASNSATQASNSATTASTSATSASTSATTATTKASEALTSASNAATSETNAATSESNAATSATNLATSESNASTSASNAATSATQAAASATAASTSATNAATSETNAQTAQTAAELAETNAETAETNASASAGTATTKAGEASTSATNAANSATSASGSASTATTKAGEASTSATNAATSETNAASSATSASNSASTATTKASEASTSAGTATTKAGEANTSATNAATSETNAGTSETNAASSASAASTSETNAASSATSASGSASTATTKASEAATSASNASTSETNAASSATSASTSASNASSSATSAASAQTAAESARDATLAAYDNFDDRYLGVKSSDPSVDNDGNALIAGALYFNSTSESMQVYTGSAWVAAYVSGTGFAALSGATFTGNVTVPNLITSGNVDGRDVSADGSKLDGIATGATANTGTITGVTAGTGLSGGGNSGTVTLSHGDTSSLSGTYGSTSNGIKIDTITVDANGHVTAVATGSGGDITGVTAGTGLSGGGSSGSVTLNLDFSELTDMTADISGTTEFILQNGTTESRKAASEIKLSAFNNDSGFTTNVGDITEVTAGTGLSGGGSSGAVTLNVSGLTISELAANSLTTSAESFADNDTTLMTSAAINDRIESFGYSTTTGTVTSVGTTGTVNGITLTGTVTSSGNLTLGGTLGNITVSQLAGSALTTSAEAFADNDTTLMTSAAINDRIESFGYTTNVGDITGVTAGSGLTGGGTSGTVTLNHEDTSTQASVNNSGRTYIQDVTLDTYGHVTGLVSATETVTDTVPNDATITLSAGVGLSGGGNFTTDQSGNETIAFTLDMSELTDMTATMVGTDEFIVLDAGADRRKAASEIGLSIFNNDSGFITSADGGNAQTLDSLDSTQFLRSDQSDTLTGDLTLISTDSGSGSDPTLILYRNSSSPATNDLIGNIVFQGRNNNSQDVEYATFQTRANDITDGSEDGNLFFKVMSGGSLSDRLAVKGANPTLFSGQNVEIHKDIDFVLKTSDNHGTTIATSGTSTNRTITLPDASGTVALTSDITGGASKGFAVAMAIAL